ncbi:GNAT family N-acetyltransferase [Microbacterium sp. 4R-513]|uniref:GNAT family N-acetyltransferase n=1 Tax=Microbacterium sp. 4R-513 TaxID=2567934 RepID=UPI0013E14E5F|nr:GNAT family N-acetyltransferase [Microbacterium sp. 4R-513]QIG40453.1 GNAT family N-acetyltransferase [Microbacterium sp. 4R-513]
MSTTTITGVEFRPLTIPDSIDSPDAGDFIEMVNVRNRIYTEISGHADHAIAADELLPHYRPDKYEVRHMWVVLRDGVMIGRVGADIPQHEGSKNLFWLIELVREAQGQGIGSAAYQLVEQTARESGRTVLQSWAEHPAGPGPRIEPPTGFGSIPEDHVARFYLHHGYTLEQVERNSALDLRGSFGQIERLLAEAREASKDYRVVQWSPPTPPEFAESYAWMKSRMATDAPAAGLEFDEEAWDAARIARHDSLYTDAGRLLLVTAAQHIETGELCAFNELVIGKDRTEASHQEDTLVLKEHRGHRLGMLVKCAALLSWREIAPESPRMITYNAEENRPMLDINEAIGFVPIAYEGAWKKVLDD